VVVLAGGVREGRAGGGYVSRQAGKRRGRRLAVHLQGANGGDDDGAVRKEAAGTALNVEELLHPNVASEAGLCEITAAR